MRIGIGSDHAGYRYKQEIARELAARGHEVCDFGTHADDAVDYPDFCFPVAAAVASGELDRGIVLGGSGNGEAMACNRFRAVRCALCWSPDTARLARQHNDANMLSLGERQITLALALEIVEIWLATPYDNGRHAPRIAKLGQVGEEV